MAFEFKFPDVGEGIHEGTVVEWLVPENSSVRLDQSFIRVETDKAIVELPSPRAGILLKQHVQAGHIVKVGQALATFGEAGEIVSTETAPVVKSALPPEPQSPEAVQISPGMKPLATPHTRSLARKLGIDLATVTPTGKGGRITDEDVERAAQKPALPSPVSQPTVSPASAPVLTGTSEIERIPMTHLRKVIAQSMIFSKKTSAHVTHVDEADVSDLFSLYQKIKARFSDSPDVKITILPFFIKAVTLALKQHPLLNASYDETAQEILLKKFYNIGIAVDTPDGLMVPVIKHADRKDMIALAREIGELAAKARNRQLLLDDLKNATFTITNVGAIGGVFATPIIHQPELAILGLHAIKDRPAVYQGALAIRKLMNISLSFDHRIIDGVAAARFMREIVDLVENPELLMMRML